MANIKNELNNIKNAMYGKDVRSSIHNGIDAINKEVESTTNRQVDLESTFDQLVIAAGNSNAEIVDARVKSDGTSYSKLGDRLDAVDSQLAHIANKGTTVEVLERVTKEEIERQISDGTIANLTIQDGSITGEKIKEATIIGRNLGKEIITSHHISKKYDLYNSDTNTDNYVLNNDGTIKEYQGYQVTDFIEVSYGDTLTIKDGRVTLLACFYNENKEYIGKIGGYALGEENRPYAFTITNQNTKYIRVNINKTSPYFNIFSILINNTRSSIEWLEVNKSNFTEELQKNIDGLDKIFDSNGDFDMSAIEGYIAPINTDGINLFNKNTVNHSYFINDGKPVSNSSYPNIVMSDYIEVRGGTLYTIANNNISSLLCEYDKDYNYLKWHKGTTNSEFAEPYSFTTQKNTKYIICNVNTNTNPLDDYYVIKGTELKEEESKGNLFNKDTFDLNGVINSNGEVVGNSSISYIGVTDYIPVKPNTSYIINFEGVANWFSEYDENKSHIRHLVGNTGIEPRRVTTSQNASYIRINVDTEKITLDDFYVMEDAGEDVTRYEFPTFTWLEERLSLLGGNNSGSTGSGTDLMASRFKGMNVLVTGDSITEKNFRASKHWHDFLKEWYGFNKVYNDGKSGSGLVKNTGIVYRIPNWYTKYGTKDDIDMILIMGPMNDGTSGETGKPEWFGTFEDQDDSMKDKSLYGALHYTCKQLIELYPNTPIGFITSQPRLQPDASQGKCWGIDGWFEKWVTAIKEVCGHYSIPVLDLYHNSGLRPWIAENNKKYFSCSSSPNGDGIHPNDLGQELMARKIYEFINRYM